MLGLQIELRKRESVEKVESLDDFRDIGDLIERDSGLKKYIFACFNDDGTIGTYISTAITEMEMIYLIENLKDRRQLEFGI